MFMYRSSLFILDFRILTLHVLTQFPITFVIITHKVVNITIIVSFIQIL